MGTKLDENHCRFCNNHFYHCLCGKRISDCVLLLKEIRDLLKELKDEGVPVYTDKKAVEVYTGRDTSVEVWNQ